ncbi:MAG: M15 family metallopeptidase, partial [Gammaproteobacteria bacterium]|nr:M15 family metallopeptidase [Gammaproteobacteria bacterium]
KGDALTTFDKLKNDVGPDLILTSGVRSVAKQLQLFLAKLNSSNNNLSLTSRSLAPPGHSYHGIGDFDVGKKGFGRLNFTSQFSNTDEYKKLIELKYVDIRYTKNNNIGVRYEPWHIKVV